MTETVVDSRGGHRDGVQLLRPPPFARLGLAVGDADDDEDDMRPLQESDSDED